VSSVVVAVGMRPRLRSLKSVAVAFEGDDFGVVNGAVDHGCGDDVVTEDPAPPAEGLVLVTIRRARS
jgi:hypothetical protein